MQPAVPCIREEENVTCQRHGGEIAEQYGCLFIPLQQDFYDAVAAYPELGHKYWLWDGIHPTPAGHQLIARKWLNMVSEWDA